jgi:predicted DNA-binding ribbon-helix-helix protein
VALSKRSVLLSGHATSVALEPEFWEVLQAIARARSVSMAGLIGQIDASRGRRPLASACRLAALDHLRGSHLAMPGATGD